jgi:hypothetical protein
MKRTFALMLISLSLFLPARNKIQKSEPQAIVEHINGMEYVHNTGTPLHPKKKVSFVEDLSISGEDNGGNVILFKPRLALVDDNENIYFIESEDQVIKVFDSSGKYLRTIGAKGSGPGEFQTITHLAAKNGKLVVMDQNTNRTSLFDVSGRFIKSFQWRTGYLRLILAKDTSLIVSEIIYSEDRRSRQLYVKEVDFEGNETIIQGEFTPPEQKPLRQGKFTVYFPLPVSTDSLFAGDAENNWFYYCVNNRYVIDVYNASGKLFRKIERPYKPVSFTDKDAEAYKAHVRSSGNEYIDKAIREMKMPKIKNIIERMIVYDEGKLWVQTNEKKGEANRILTAFDIFDSDGYYFAKVWTAILPSIFKKGKMYRMDADQDTGYQSLKRYKVIWE